MKVTKVSVGEVLDFFNGGMMRTCRFGFIQGGESHEFMVTRRDGESAVEFLQRMIRVGPRADLPHAERLFAAWLGK